MQQERIKISTEIKKMPLRGAKASFHKHGAVSSFYLTALKNLIFSDGVTHAGDWVAIWTQSASVKEEAASRRPSNSISICSEVPLRMVMPGGSCG